LTKDLTKEFDERSAAKDYLRKKDFCERLFNWRKIHGERTFERKTDFWTAPALTYNGGNKGWLRFGRM